MCAELPSCSRISEKKEGVQGHLIERKHRVPCDSTGSCQFSKQKLLSIDKT